MTEAEGQDRTLPSSPDATWTVYRVNDNGNQFVVRRHLSHEEAKRLVTEFETRGHKRT